MLENSYLLVRDVKGNKSDDWYSIDEPKTTLSIYDPLQGVVNRKDEAKSDEEEKRKEFKYEKYSRIFGPRSSLHDVYIGSDFSDYVDGLFKGKKHLAMFYGQTGSGKSYYLMGENNYDLERSIATSDRVDNPNDTRGLIVRMVKNIFKKIQKLSAGDKEKEDSFRLSLTYYDLYLDKIRDIGKYANEHLREEVKNDLNSITQDQLERQFIKTEEKPDGSTMLKNLTNIDIHDSNEIAYIIDKGTEAQEIINKRLNISESAVHTIITLTFRNDDKKRIGKACFIDCAGSEWNSKNVSENLGIQESIIINNSFNSLSKIVNLIRAK
jgi:hypothetical protein